ncbi:hypothetical protein KIPB_010597, partial [Kipferlia bialata]|eukprot:g10597.t1
MPRVLSLTDLESGVCPLLRLERVSLPRDFCPAPVGHNMVFNMDDACLYTVVYSEDGRPTLEKGQDWPVHPRMSTAVCTGSIVYYPHHCVHGETWRERRRNPGHWSVYHMDTDTWSLCHPPNGPSGEEVSQLSDDIVVDGKILRCYESQVWLFDPDSETWVRQPDKPRELQKAQNWGLTPLAVGDSVVFDYRSSDVRGLPDNVNAPDVSDASGVLLSLSESRGWERLSGCIGSDTISSPGCFPIGNISLSLEYTGEREVITSVTVEGG